MFGRKVMTIDLRSNHDKNRLFKVIERGWVPIDYLQIGRETKRHDWVRVTLRRRRLGEKKFKMGVVNTIYVQKRYPGMPTDQS